MLKMVVPPPLSFDTNGTSSTPQFSSVINREALYKAVNTVKNEVKKLESQRIRRKRGERMTLCKVSP